MPRIKKHIIQKPVLFIACEGTSSEYQYFTSWGQTDEALEHYNRIQVYPSENEHNPKTTPFELLTIAKQVIVNGEADMAWIVFDKDNHPNLPQTFLEAAQYELNIAFSSRSFEHWVLLHYEKNNDSFTATECKDANGKPIRCGTIPVPNCMPVPCLTGHLRRQNYIAGYSKKKDFDLYGAINHRTYIAAVNAAWLRFVTNAQPPLYDLNPYTDVDRLIFKMLGRKEFIVWGNHDEFISANRWNLKVTREGANLNIRACHDFPAAIVINQDFKDTSFFTTDDDLNNTLCAVNTVAVLTSDNGSTLNLLYHGDTLEFKLTYNQQPYFLFWDRANNIRVYIVL